MHLINNQSVCVCAYTLSGLAAPSASGVEEVVAVIAVRRNNYMLKITQTKLT